MYCFMAPAAAIGRNGSVRPARMASTSAAALALSLIFAPAAFAQDQTAAPAEAAPAAEAPNEVIVVTGSRITRRDNVADSPIVTVSTEALKNSASPSLEASLNQLPQFKPAGTRFATGADSAAQATINLRALGDYRTLVLIDGHRPQPGNARVTFDLNTLPSSIIENVEVITGGASAVYGSDAIAGVVNFITKKNFSGLQLDGRASISEKGDGAEYQLGVLLGGGFADDRGHALLALDYTKREPVYQNTRDFYTSAYRNGTSTLASPYLPTGYYVPTTGNLPSMSVINSVFSGYGTPGTIAGGSSIGFNNDGTLFSVGGGLNYRGALNPEYAKTAAGNVVYNSGYPQLLAAPMERYSVYGALRYDVTDAIQAYSNFSYADYTTRTNAAGASADGLWAINVPRDAAHPIPADLARILDSRPNPTASFQVGKRLQNAGNITVDHPNQVYSITLGLKGKLGIGDLKWDVYGSHGKTTISDNYVEGAVVYDRLLTLVQRPNYGAGTALNGITCTSGIQLFGTAAMSDDCVRAITAQLKRSIQVTQDIAEANLNGSIVELPAGSLGFAAGASWRQNKYSFTPDALIANSQANGVVGVFGSEPTRGSTNVKEFYGELLVPILKDSAIAKSLDLDLAYRYSDYNLSGGVSTYKASVNWAVRDWFRVRGGYQRAIRAPNVNELFSGRSLTVSPWADGDPCSVTSKVSYGNNASNPNLAKTKALCVALGVPAGAIDTLTYATPLVLGEPVGNPNVKPEKANTYTAGFVLSPKFESPLLRRLSFSADFYQIEVKGAIGTLPAATIYARCFNATGENPTYSASSPYCRNIGRDNGSTTVSGIASGIPTTTAQPFVNLGGYKTRGVDFQLDWRADLTDSIRFGLNVVASYLDSFQIQSEPTAKFVEYKGTIGNTTTGNGTLPEWTTNTTATFNIGDAWTLGARWRWLDSMRYFTNVSIPGNTTAGTGAYSNFDLFGSVNVTKAYTLRLGVDNLTDKAPLVVSGIPGTTDPATYDPIGRRYYVSVTAKF